MTSRGARTAAGMLALLAALSLPATSASAQEVAFKVGVAVSRLAPDQPAALREGRFDRSHVGMTFGGHYRWTFGPVAVQPELGLTARGAVSADEAQKIRIEYVELPVMLLVPAQLGPVQVYGMGGPYVAFESRCRYTEEEEGLRTSAGCEFVPDAFDRRSLDWGAAAGAGGSFRLGAGKVILEARHAWGLRSINAEQPELDIRNRTFTVTVGYTLRLDSTD